jgi:hypothetical protein
MNAATGLLHVLAHVRRGILLVGPADLADQQDAVGVRIFLEQPQTVHVIQPAHGVAADADARALGDAQARALPHRLVRQRAAAADDAHGLARAAPLLGPVHVDVPRHDADLAPGIGVRIARALARAGLHARCNDARAVRADQRDQALCRVAVGAAGGEIHLIENGPRAHHVLHGDTLGDAADHPHTGVGRLEHRIGREGRGHEDHGRFRPGLGDRLLHRVEDGDRGVLIDLELRAALARCHAAHNAGSIAEAPAGVDGAE